MAANDFMNKVRYWDSLIAKWLMRHFYFMFFQLVLVIIFVVWLTSTIQVIEISYQIDDTSVLERLAASQSVNTSIIVLLLLLNSFWLLYVFNGIQRIRNVLRDMNFNLSRMRFREK